MEYKGGIYSGVYEPERLADVWWCSGSGYEVVGTYTMNGRTATIACVGEMCILMVDDGTRIYSADDLPYYVTNDKEWYEFLNRTDLTIIDNCWLEVWENDGLLDSEVCGDLTEALEAAYAFLTFPEGGE